MSTVKSTNNNKGSQNKLSKLKAKDKSKKKVLTKFESQQEGFRIWTQFYRENPHRFATEYFGIGLFLFQKILLFMMDKVGFFMFIAARGEIPCPPI